MLHSQTTRARRRAAGIASSHSAPKARRRLLSSTAVVGAAIGISLLAGFVPASAAGSMSIVGAGAVGVNAPDDASANGAVPLAEITDDAAAVLLAAQAAVSAADDVTGEVAASGLDLGAVATSIDTTDLQADIDELSDKALVPPLLLIGITADTRAETRKVADLTATLRSALDDAQERAAAEKAAAEAAARAAEAAAQAAEKAAALAAVNTVDGAKATAQSMAADTYGWGSDQFSCLDSLWTKESGWNYQAANSSSGAYGIPQALPGSKMASAGGDWQTSAATQIAWGLGYIADVYGTPCAAWSHSQATNWY